MSERTVNPELFHLCAALLNWAVIERERGDQAGATVAALGAAGANLESLQLRWMTAPPIGLPRAPFTVYRLNGVLALNRLSNVFGFIAEENRLNFPELMGVVQLQFNLTAPGAFVLAFSQKGALLTAASAPSGATGPVALTVQNSGIAYVLFGATSGDLTAIYGLSSYAIANLPAWAAIETVGLPVTPAAFAGSGYSTANQGLVSAPVAPVQAAVRRLQAGAPPIGWPTQIAPGVPAPPWVPPAIHPLLADLQSSILGDLRYMLGASTGPSGDASVLIKKVIQAPVQPGGPPPATSQPSHATYSPLSTLLVAAGCDPFNALGLGFGTAYSLPELTALLGGDQARPVQARPVQSSPVQTSASTVTVAFNGFMVTADYDLSLFGIDIKGELADFVTTNLQQGLTPAPAGLSVAAKPLNPPLVRDQPYTGTFDAQWARPLPLLPVQAVAVSYAVGRGAPGGAAELLNATRRSGGLMPFAPSLPPDGDANAPIVFEDATAVSPAGGSTVAYSVTAQDWFGVWSLWAGTDVGFPAEPLIGPSVTDAQLTLAETTASPYTACLTAQVAYNWTTRSPKEIDLLVTLFRPPDAVTPLPAQTAPAGIQYTVGGPVRPLVSLTFDAAGNPAVAGAAGATVTQQPPPSWASPQQDVRVYSVVIPGFSLDFAGANEIVAFVFATGYETVHPATPVTTANPRVAHVMSPTPPPPPRHDFIVWSSLPDQSGISRVDLNWDANGAPAGTSFVIYTATETGMLGAAGAPPADLNASYASRLAALRALDLTTCRPTFRRVGTTPSPLTAPSQEVELPRGTRVLHAFVITSVSPNNVETPFPTDATKFIAVAVPFVQVPRAPRIFTRLVTNGGIAQAEVHVESRTGVTPDRFLLYRTQREGLSRDADLMGPPITTSDQGGWVKSAVDPSDGTWTAVYTDPTPPTTLNPWQRIWYRAVAVADDQLTDASGNPFGALGGRSPASSVTTIVVPPPTPPALAAVNPGTIDHANQTVLVTLETDAPISATALGSHTLTATVTDPQQPVAAAVTWRASIPLEQLPLVGAFPASGAAGTAARLGAFAGLTGIGVWVPRPTRTNSATSPFAVTVKITDPVGRSTQVSANVGWWV
jgi:hypothetical protein